MHRYLRQEETPTSNTRKETPMEFMTWLLLAGAAVGAAAVWYSWKRRRKSKIEE